MNLLHQNKRILFILLCCVSGMLQAQTSSDGNFKLLLNSDAKVVARSIADTFGAEVRIVERFVNEAQRLEKTTGVPATAMIAITVLESRGFTSYLFKNSNNPFGLKGWPPYKGKTFTMWHEGEMTPFRAYDTPEEALVDFAAFLKSRRWFKDAFACGGSNYSCFLKGLLRTAKQPGYSADPKWGDKVNSIIQRFGLTKLATTKPKAKPASKTATKTATKPSTGAKKAPPAPKTVKRK